MSSGGSRVEMSLLATACVSALGSGSVGGTDGPCRRRPGMQICADSESDEPAGLAAMRPTGSGESSPNPVSTAIRSVLGSFADLKLSVVGLALADESSPSYPARRRVAEERLDFVDMNNQRPGASRSLDYHIYEAQDGYYQKLPGIVPLPLRRTADVQPRAVIPDPGADGKGRWSDTHVIALLASLRLLAQVSPHEGVRLAIQTLLPLDDVLTVGWG